MNRHFENRQGEGPGDEVDSFSSTQARIGDAVPVPEWNVWTLYWGLLGGR